MPLRVAFHVRHNELTVDTYGDFRLRCRSGLRECFGQVQDRTISTLQSNDVRHLSSSPSRKFPNDTRNRGETFVGGRPDARYKKRLPRGTAYCCWKLSNFSRPTTACTQKATYA